MINVKLNDIRCVSKVDGPILQQVLKLGHKLNGFCLRGGEHPGYGHLLMIRSDLTDAILEATDLTLTIYDDSTTTVELTGLQIVETRHLCPNETENDLVIVTITDGRFFPQRNFLRAPSVFTSNYDFSPTAPADWEAGLKLLWDEMNIDFPSASLDFTNADFPTQLPEDIRYDQQPSASRVFHHLLQLSSHCLYKTPDGFSVVPLGYTNNANDALVAAHNNRLINTRGDKSSMKVLKPSSMVLLFEDETRLSPHIRTVAASGDSNPTLFEEIWFFNYYLPSIHADSYYNGLGDSLANLRLDAWDNHLVFNAIYVGVIGFTPGGEAHEIEYWHDFTDNRYKTLVKSVDMTKMKIEPVQIESDFGLIFFKAPSGGIPARVGTLLGSVTDCIVQRTNPGGKTIIATSMEIEVHNWGSVIVCSTGYRYGFAGWYNGKWWYIQDDCQDAATGTGGPSTGGPGTGGFTSGTTTNSGQAYDPGGYWVGGLGWVSYSTYYPPTNDFQSDSVFADIIP